MEELIDLIATNQSPSDISDQIKGVLYAKAAERIDSFRPDVAATMFNVDDENNQVGDDE